jgi:plastocyanin
VDPEQIYEEVLKEEQAKGVSGPVAEGRAKSARARAEAGSPHPKEPKWWPGAQPHLEGGDGEAAEAEEEAPAAEEPLAEELAAEEPAAEEPAAEEPAVEEPAAPAEEEQAAPPAPEPAAAPEPAPAQPAAEAQPAAVAAAAPAATAPAEAARPAGVTHGTKTGTRLRPEDEVTTDAQFEGQQAMYERRKLIDELVSTGVPAVAAQETGRSRTPWLAVLYLIIPLVVIAYLAGQESSEGTEAPPPPPETSEDGGGGGAAALVASGTEWDTDTLTVPAGEPAEVEVTNDDPVVHNMSIYQDDEAALAKQDPLFLGEDVEGGASVTYQIEPPLDPGTYTFICDYHTNMIGDITAE